MNTMTPTGAKGPAALSQGFSASKSNSAQQIMNKPVGPSELDRHKAVMASEAKQAPAKAARQRASFDPNAFAKRVHQDSPEISLMRKIVEAKPSPLEQYQAKMLNDSKNQSRQTKFQQSLKQAVKTK